MMETPEVKNKIQTMRYGMDIVDRKPKLQHCFFPPRNISNLFNFIWKKNIASQLKNELHPNFIVLIYNIMKTFFKLILTLSKKVCHIYQTYTEVWNYSSHGQILLCSWSINNLKVMCVLLVTNSRERYVWHVSVNYHSHPYVGLTIPI